MQKFPIANPVARPLGRRAGSAWLIGLSLALGVAAMPATVCAGDATGATTSAPVAAALVSVDGAWVRSTVKGQTATGGFMTLRARQNLTLVGFRSPQSPHAELHEMAMEGDIMRMRAVKSLPLPAGKDVALRPGGHHLMLMGLTAPLSAGQQITLELLLKDEQGKVLVQGVQVPVSTVAPRGDKAMGGGHDGMDMPGHHHH